MLHGDSRANFPLQDPLGDRVIRMHWGIRWGAFAEGVVTVRLILGAGDPRRLTRDGSGLDFVFR